MKIIFKPIIVFAVFLFLSFQANALSTQKTYIYAVQAETTSQNAKIKKYDNDGNLVSEWPLSYAAGVVATTNNGTVLVSDGAKVHIYNSDGKKIKSWNCSNYSAHLAVDSKGYVYVSMIFDPIVYKYDLNGKLLESWTWVKDQLDHIVSISIDHSDKVYLVGSSGYHGRVCQYTSDGKFLGYIGDPKNFQIVEKIVFDSSGNGYLTDFRSEAAFWGWKIHVFNSRGVWQRDFVIAYHASYPHWLYNDTISIDASNTMFFMARGQDWSDLKILHYKLDGSMINSWRVDPLNISIASGVK